MKYVIQHHTSNDFKEGDLLVHIENKNLIVLFVAYHADNEFFAAYPLTGKIHSNNIEDNCLGFEPKEFELFKGKLILKN